MDHLSFKYKAKCSSAYLHIVWLPFSDRPSVNNLYFRLLPNHLMDLHEIWYLLILCKISQEMEQGRAKQCNEGPLLGQTSSHTSRSHGQIECIIMNKKVSKELLLQLIFFISKSMFNAFWCLWTETICMQFYGGLCRKESICTRFYVYK